MKNIIRLSYSLGVALIALVPGYQSLSVAAKPKRTRIIVVSPSRILSDVSERMKKQSPTARELAVYANGLLEKKGFDYQFHVCDAFTKSNRIPNEPPAVERYHRMTLTSGGKIPFKFTVSSPQEGMCGECWSDIPSSQVTKREMVVIAEGKRYRVRRPRTFVLDTAELVDGTMKKVLRTWTLPYQAVPIGISADGTRLYLDFYTDYELDGLVLALSEDGGIEFMDRAGLQLQGEGELLDDYPKDPRNAYLSFKRFQAGNKNYIVRFSAPCT